MVSKSAGSIGSSLTRIDIKERSGHNDDLVVQGCTEKVHSGVQPYWQFGEVTPTVKSTIRWVIHANSELSQSVDHPVSFARKVGLKGVGLCIAVGTVYQVDRGPLHGS